MAMLYSITGKLLSPQDNYEFVTLLASIRAGRCTRSSAAVKELLDRCARPLDTSDGIHPTQALPKILEVWLVGTLLGLCRKQRRIYHQKIKMALEELISAAFKDVLAIMCLASCSTTRFCTGTKDIRLHLAVHYKISDLWCLYSCTPIVWMWTQSMTSI